ncbi:MAG: MgtC/SapB family protein [Gammaproteobacteria bacterium]|nr:MgtC/SapB family protein [Gammaproteobacteria bacterium]
MENWQIQLILIGKIAFGMLLGGVIGWERELSDKPAGFRTHMLIAGSTSFFVGLAYLLTVEYQAFLPEGTFRPDPIRILQAVVIGVSFIGAGTIFQARDKKVEGLTTAATILFVAGVGMACGLGYYILAVCTTLLGLLVLRFILRFEKRVVKR